MKQTPQERKIQDYMHKRKNAYGGNDKNSRRAIRKSKRWVNRAFRKNIKNITDSSAFEPEETDSLIRSIKRHQWKKYPDELLLESLDSKWSGSSRTTVKAHQSKLRREAVKRIRKSSIKR